MNKFIWPLAIILASIVLGGSFYAVQISKQESIERQQSLELEEERRIEGLKAEQTQKEYSAKRKTDCLAIYNTEHDNWNNVRGWRYDESDDECYIRYKNPDTKTDAECDELYPKKTEDGKLSLLFWRENALCKDGEFENSF